MKDREFIVRAIKVLDNGQRVVETPWSVHGVGMVGTPVEKCLGHRVVDGQDFGIELVLDGTPDVLVHQRGRWVYVDDPAERDRYLS
ncbi:hypothetical protein [Carbonactinospora thermoautotrophica]|uniref:hypothetical protein n=1 Tax=Carbonactinospora thermoautotrophica TaxID=1469144 RepID=UPI00227107AC|nr:hypothetical protein [Carbonactinospora thermoautotrophica]